MLAWALIFLLVAVLSWLFGLLVAWPLGPFLFFVFFGFFVGSMFQYRRERERARRRRARAVMEGTKDSA